MAAPLLLAGLSLLPKIPAMWSAVAGLFGKKVPKSVSEAGKLASSVLDSVKKGEISPEVQVELEKEINRHKERMAELALEEKELNLKDKEIEFKGEELVVKSLSDIADVEKEAYKTEDVFVRRTRPKILRDFFKLAAAYALYAPLSIVAGHTVGLEAAVLLSYISMVEWIGGWLFGTFATAYIGYAGARMVDKKNPNFKEGAGFLNKVIKKMI